MHIENMENSIWNNHIFTSKRSVSNHEKWRVKLMKSRISWTWWDEREWEMRHVEYLKDEHDLNYRITSECEELSRDCTRGLLVGNWFERI